MKPTPTLIAAGLIALLAYTPARAGWTNDPWNGMVSVCDAPGRQEYIRSCELAGGRTLVAWIEYTLQPQKIYYQIINNQGNPLLSTNGVTLFIGNWITGWSTTTVKCVISDGIGGCLVVVSDYRDGTPQLYGQRLDSMGNRLWGDNGLPIVFLQGTNDIHAQDVASDSLGSFFVSWYYGWPGADAYVQKFNVNGVRFWGDYGVPVCVQGGAQYYIHLVPDNQGGVEVMWRDERYGLNNPRLYFQHINAVGSPLLTLNGVPVYGQGGGYLGGAEFIEGEVDGTGGGIWAASYGGGPTLVHLMRINAQGHTNWSWTTWAPYQRYLQGLLRHNDGTYYMSVEENQAISPGDYLYHFDFNGIQFFGEHGLEIGGYLTPTTNGVIAGVNASWNPATILIARRAISDGQVIWRSPFALDHLEFAFGIGSYCSDGADGAVYGLWDGRNLTDYNILAQRVNADGTLGTPPKIKSQPEKTIDSQPPGGTPMFILEKAGLVTVELYDILGRRVALLEEGFREVGPYNINIDKGGLASGVYIVKLISAGKEQRQKIVITR